MARYKDEAEALANYDPKQYRTPDGYTSDIAVFTIVSDEKDEMKRTVKILLIKRAALDAEGEPNIEGGKWALPGGFIVPPETAYEAAKRELREETGVENIHIQHYGVYDAWGRDPRGWIISNAHYAIVSEEALARRRAADDAAEVALFDLAEVGNIQLAFDHRAIIEDAVKVVKSDMLTTTVAKNFLPEEFKLEELRTVLLAVIDDPVISVKSAFFRKAPSLPFITEALDEHNKPKVTTPTGRAKRPTQLYRFVDVWITPSIWR
ncbi:NUDIX domain-containing protein [Aneurinibacillus sp. REN35]|uniref:NUDIX domain-containing protein n=1 Tax=Aneurinibacillus sp. REN35 TaxID=3237286 RepID=UPI003529919B